jgi:hypothetical protein
MNDLGAWDAAQQTLNTYGKGAFDEWWWRVYLYSSKFKYSI